MGWGAKVNDYFYLKAGNKNGWVVTGGVREGISLGLLKLKDLLPFNMIPTSYFGIVALWWCVVWLWIIQYTDGSEAYCMICCRFSLMRAAYRPRHGHDLR